MIKDLVTVEQTDPTNIKIHLNRPCSIEQEKKYELNLKEYKSKRSLQQNSYLWALMTEIVKKENGGRCDEELLIHTYCTLLEKANAKFEFILCRKEAVEELKKRFRATKVINEVVINDYKYTQVQVFYGSSTMNLKEMANLIDVVLDYGYEIGLEDIDNYWKEILKG